MLLEGNACPADDLVKLGIEPKHFSGEALNYLNASLCDTVTA